MNRMTSELNQGLHASSSTVVPLARVNDVVPTVEYREIEWSTVDFIEVVNTNIGISTLKDDGCKPSVDCIDAVNVNTDISTVEDDECKPSVGFIDVIDVGIHVLWWIIDDDKVNIYVATNLEEDGCMHAVSFCY